LDFWSLGWSVQHNENSFFVPVNKKNHYSSWAVLLLLMHTFSLRRTAFGRKHGLIHAFKHRLVLPITKMAANIAADSADEKELNSRRLASTSVHAERILFDVFLDSR